MPQNWWEKFPEVMPSPAAQRYPLPAPGGIMPGPGMGLGLGPDPLSGAPLLGQVPGGGFDLSYLSGAPMMGQIPGGSPDQAPPIGYPQPPFAGDQAGPLSDRRLAVQQAAAAIRDGADPRAVRARLNQVGTDNAGFDPSDLFSDFFPGGAAGAGQFTDNDPAVPASLGGPSSSGGDSGPVLDRDAIIQHATTAIQRGADPNAVRMRLTQMGLTDMDPPSPLVDLIPDAPQAPSAMNDPGISPPMSARPPQQDQSGMGGGHPAAYAQDSLRDLQRRADPSSAPQKGDDASKYYQAKANDPGGDRSGALGRAIVDDVQRLTRPSDPSPSNLTPWQQRRRQQNEMLATNPRVRAFLDMISHSEGDTNYRSLFGNHHQTFTDQSTHPGNRGEIYRGRRGGAAGRYQITPRTYSSLNRLLGPYTMSDRDQDLMAVELIREANALGPLVSGQQPDLATAISRLGRRQTWASFPVLENGSWQPNPSHQPTRNFEDLQRSFSGALDQARRRLGYR